MKCDGWTWNRLAAAKQDKRCPSILVRNDRASEAAARLGRGIVTVVPVTSSVQRVFPFQVLLPAEQTGLRVNTKAQAERVRSVSVERLGQVMGRLLAVTVAAMDKAFPVHLEL